MSAALRHVVRHELCAQGKPHGLGIVVVFQTHERGMRKAAAVHQPARQLHRQGGFSFAALTAQYHIARWPIRRGGPRLGIGRRTQQPLGS